MAAKLRFECTCGKSLLADIASAGKKAKCPGCGQILVVPAPPTTASGGPSSQADTRPTAARSGPPPLPSASQPQPAAADGLPDLPAAGNSLWDEIDDYRPQELPPTACPSCGSEMKGEAVVCMQCGFNRKTGTAAPVLAAPSAASRQAPRRQPAFLDRLRGRIGGGGSTVAARIGVAMVVFGGIAFWLGFNEKRLSDASSKEPEVIALKNLIDRGLDGNPNIMLTDFDLCQNFVYQGQKIGGQFVGSWKKVWVPIVPSAPLSRILGIAPAAQNVQALIVSTRVENQGELTKLVVPRLRGLVTNRISSLGSEEKKILKQSYPTIDFDRCLIIEEGREPKASQLIALYLGGGAALVVVGGLLVARRFL